MKHKLRYLWGLCISTVSLPLTLVYGILFLVQWVILATLLIPVFIGDALKVITIWLHRVGGPKIQAGENLNNPVARFNHFVFEKELKL
jgi:hypothetical protein